MTASVVTIGSLHADLIAYADRFPSTGLSTLGSRFVLAPGGKAANQAHQIARFGVPSLLIAQVGADALGDAILEPVSASGIDTRGVVRAESEATGASTIFAVEGEYQSIIVSGSGPDLDPAHITALVRSSGAGFVVGQREVPDKVTSVAFAEAKQIGAITVLNVSPLTERDRDAVSDLLGLSDVVVLNRHEASVLLDSHVTSGDDAVEAAVRIRTAFGAATVVITCGELGAVLASDRENMREPAFAVEVADSVGAGDALLGGMVGAWASGMDDQAALKYGIGAAALSVQRPGGFGSMASRRAIERLLNSVDRA